MRKAQIEIMGLVIIVVLLVFIMIFALSFIIKPEQENNDILKVKANSLRASILKTNICPEVTIKDEIENCVDGYHECIECNKLQEKIETMIKGSLETNEGYDFIVVEASINLNKCVDGITGVSQNLRNANVEVALCRIK